MKNYILILMGMLLLLGCGSSSGGGDSSDTVNELNVDRIIIRDEIVEISVGNGDLYMDLLFLNKEGEEISNISYEVYIEDRQYRYSDIKNLDLGEYELYIETNNIRSNVVKLAVIDRFEKSETKKLMGFWTCRDLEVSYLLDRMDFSKRYLVTGLSTNNLITIGFYNSQENYYSIAESFGNSGMLIYLFKKSPSSVVIADAVLLDEYGEIIGNMEVLLTYEANRNKSLNLKRDNKDVILKLTNKDIQLSETKMRIVRQVYQRIKK